MLLNKTNPPNYLQGMGNVQDARREMTKTKEQLEEEKKISLSIRIKPLELDGMDGDALKEKASELWEVSSLLNKARTINVVLVALDMINSAR